MWIRFEMTAPVEFRISRTPRRLLRVLVRTIRLPCLVGLSLTLRVSPGGTLVTPKANRIRRGAFVDAGSLNRAALRLTKMSMRLVHCAPEAGSRLHWMRMSQRDGVQRAWGF